MEAGLTKNQIVTQLSKSTHGHLAEYVAVTREAAKTDPEFLAHLIAWNAVKGQVRDSKVALPVITLTADGYPSEFIDNSMAHLAQLDPRNLLRGIAFAKAIRRPGVSGKHQLRRFLQRYLRALEGNWSLWQTLAVQHRESLRKLYQTAHIAPSETANVILFKRGSDRFSKPYPRGSVFEAIAQLKDMSAGEAAGTILNRRLPHLIASVALGKRAKEPEIVQALIERMTPTDLVTNTKWLERLGMRSNPALRGAYEAALMKAQTSKKNTLKTSRAAEALESGGNIELAEKLKALQEKQVKAIGGVDGNWLVLADRSPSMEKCIEIGRQVATLLSTVVNGEVHLIFFDAAPLYVNATGLTYETLRKATEHIGVGGGTSIGCGLQYAIDRKLDIDGIAVISDAKENQPPLFADRYKRYCATMEKEPTVYLYRFEAGMNCTLDRDLAVSMREAGLDMTEFDLRKSAMDYYSVVNLVPTMRVNRYSLVDEILATPLLTQDEVFAKLLPNVRKEELVYA